MVNRYDEEMDGGFGWNPDGSYVLFEDYEVLRAKFDRLVEHVEKAPHASMSCTSHTVQPDGFALPARCGCWKRAVLAEVGR